MTLTERLAICEELIRQASEKGDWTLPIMMARYQTLIGNDKPQRGNDD